MLKQIFFVMSFQSLTAPFLVNARHSEYPGEVKRCNFPDNNYFVVVYKRGAACGGALISREYAVLGAFCLEQKLGGKRTKKWLRAGHGDLQQFRAIVKTQMCHKKAGCDFGVVKTRKPLKLSPYVDTAKLAVKNNVRFNVAMYVYVTFRKPWATHRSLTMFCVEIMLNDCAGGGAEKSTLCGKVQTKSGKMSEDAYYSNDDGGVELGYKDEDEDIEDEGICKDNTGGPLMAGDAILGFLKGYVCQPKEKRNGTGAPEQLHFGYMASKQGQVMKLTGINMRSIIADDDEKAPDTLPESSTESSEGRSLHGHTGILIKFLSIVTTILPFILLRE